MEQPRPEQISASRKKLIMLIMIAFVPIFIAYAWFNYFPDLAPGSSTNNGRLIAPPVDGEAIHEQLAAYDTWILLQPVKPECDEDCVQMLYLSRQVVTGLGKDASRVQRVLLAPDGISPEFETFLGIEHSDIEVIRAALGPLEAQESVRPVLFLMDPNANIMMSWLLEMAGKPMLKDLKHLLKISSIG